MTPASASDARRSQSSRVASRCARGACGFVSARTRVKLGERILRRIATPTRASMRETPRRDARERAKDGMLTTRAVVSGFAGKAHLWRRNSRTRGRTPTACALFRGRRRQTSERGIPRYSARSEDGFGGRERCGAVCAAHTCVRVRKSKQQQETPRQQASAVRAIQICDLSENAVGCENLVRTPKPSSAGLARAGSDGGRARPPARCSARRFSRRALSRRASRPRRATRFSSPKGASSPRETGSPSPTLPRWAWGSGRTPPRLPG